MQVGLVISILMHAAILGGALFSFQSRQQLRVPEPEAVAVGMIAPSEVTKVRLGVRTAKQLESAPKESPKGDIAKKESPKAKVAAAAPPPPPPPAASDQKPDPIAQKLAEPPPPPATPPPAPPAEAQEKLEAERQERDRQAAEKLRAEEQKRAEEKKRAEEQKRAEDRKRLEEERRQAELRRKAAQKKRREAALKRKREEEKRRREAEAAKKKQFDADKIAALLNKVPDRAAPPPSAPPAEPTKAKGPALGAPDGRDKQISASEMAMLKGRISSRLKACWRLPSGGGGSDTPIVTLRWRLKPDGSLDGDPQVEQPRSDPLFRLAAEAAQRAVRECSPFDLPPERYNVWRTIIWDFDPSRML